MTFCSGQCRQQCIHNYHLQLLLRPHHWPVCNYTQDGIWFLCLGCLLTCLCIRCCCVLQQEGYELMETHDGNGTIIIVDYLQKSMIGNIQASSAYTAGPQHVLFSLSLSDIYRQDLLSQASDFLRVDGVPVSSRWCL